MSRMIFVNLPVGDLQRTIDFWTGLGFEFNPQFTDDQATCMMVSDHACVMLLAQEYFSTFTSKELVDAHKQTEALLALSAASREEVDTLTDRALSLGASFVREPEDHGYMYGRSFEDLDGHIWEVVFMDPAALEEQTV